MEGGSRTLRCLVAAFGDPGHVFPALALSRALKRRGHEVVLETWPKWKVLVEAEGVGFAAADAYRVFPPPESGEPGGGEAALALMPLLEEFRPDVVVNDVLTVAPALAAEVHGARRVTLVPHIFPEWAPGTPPFALGATRPRTGFGRAAWRRLERVMNRGLIAGRDDLNAQRAVAGLPPTERFHGATSEELVLVGTFPQLEYLDSLPTRAKVTGPMEFEPPHPDVEIPEGPEPLIVIAPSTSQDPDHRLVRTSLDGLADQPVRVLATVNRTGADPGFDVPDNAVVLDWARYSQVFPLASAVVCHGGHGTMARALAAGVPVLACPAAGDMNENGVRLTWSGAGLAIRGSLAGPRAIRLAVAELLGEESFRMRAGEIAAWSREHDGPETGARSIEALVG